MYLIMYFWVQCSCQNRIIHLYVVEMDLQVFIPMIVVDSEILPLIGEIVTECSPFVNNVYTFKLP